MATENRKTEGYIYPKEFFQKNKPQIVGGSCFVIMPFEEGMDRVYEEVISKTLLEYGLTPIRADKIFDTKPIMIAIMEKINDAELIIADVTGRNPNVFYELGMTHVLKDKVILVTQTAEDVPFDLRHLRFILYEQGPEGEQTLRNRLTETLMAIGMIGKIPEAVSSVEQPISEAGAEVPLPEPLSTEISFTVDPGDWTDLKGTLFAKLTQWVEYDQVEDRFAALKFPGGAISLRGSLMILTLWPGGLQLPEILESFRMNYRAIRFNSDKQFNLGDLVRRSRGSRTISSLATKAIKFSFDNMHADLDVENTTEGSSVIIRCHENYYFKPIKPPISYYTVLKYLEKDPPTDELQKCISQAIV